MKIVLKEIVSLEESWFADSIVRQFFFKENYLYNSPKRKPLALAMGINFGMEL